MAKIKVGDWVKRKDDDLGFTFSKDNGPFRVVRVYNIGAEEVLELHRSPDGSSPDGWYTRKFDVVSDPNASAETYILIVRENGKLKPATTPRVLTSEAQAKAVAASMAEKHPGKEFLIFKAVGKAQTRAAVVEMF